MLQPLNFFINEFEASRVPVAFRLLSASQRSSAVDAEQDWVSGKKDLSSEVLIGSGFIYCIILMQ
jgi:hypothetical protein